MVCFFRYTIYDASVLPLLLRYLICRLNIKPTHNLLEITLYFLLVYLNDIIIKHKKISKSPKPKVMGARSDGFGRQTKSQQICAHPPSRVYKFIKGRTLPTF